MRRLAALGVALAALAGCGETATCDDCNTLVIAVTGEPTTLIPPLVRETVGRDITDQIYERLATLAPGGSPADPAAYRPELAARWERPDSASIRFVLRSGATWHDGRPVTAGDVVFSFAAFTDEALGAPADELVDRVTVTAEGDSAVLVRFNAPDGEMMYDATYGVRILPEHLWSELPRAEWASDTSLARIVGSGPFRLTNWTRGQSLILERAAANADDGIQRMVWRFAGDQDAAVNLLLAGQADLIETVTSPSAREQVSGDSSLREIPYPSAVQGYVGLRHASANGAPDPILGNRAVRRALVLALDRGTLIRAVIGPDAVVPPGPISRAMWIWDDAIATLPYDTTRANQLLDSVGFARTADGTRRRGATRLTVDILVPGTSTIRRNLAQGIQEMWRQVGVTATVTAVDFPVFQQRLTAGRFEAMVGAWLDQPSPRGLADQWTRRGWGNRNYGRYGNAAFDSLFAVASATADPAKARVVWRQALDTLNADVAGIFLYTPTNVAVASRRLSSFEVNPFSWLSQAATITKR